MALGVIKEFKDGFNYRGKYGGRRIFDITASDDGRALQVCFRNPRFGTVISCLHMNLSFEDLCRWRTTRPGDILDRGMRAAQRSHGLKWVGMQYVAPFTHITQQTWLQACLVALGIYNIYQSSMDIIKFQNFGVTDYQNFTLDIQVAVQC